MTADFTGPTITCSGCGSSELEPGFIDDAASGRIRWFRGSMRIGLFGNSKGRMFGERWRVLAARCRNCSRLELYAGEKD